MAGNNTNTTKFLNYFMGKLFKGSEFFDVRWKQPGMNFTDG